MQNVDRDLTTEEIEKCRSDTVEMEDEDCISQMFQHLKIYKDEPEWLNVKSEPVFGENELKFIVHNG